MLNIHKLHTDNDFVSKCLNFSSKCVAKADQTLSTFRKAKVLNVTTLSHKLL